MNSANGLKAILQERLNAMASALFTLEASQQTFTALSYSRHYFDKLYLCRELDAIVRDFVNGECLALELKKAYREL